MKIKARDIVENWPYPRSFTVQPPWNPGQASYLMNREQQAKMLEKFRKDAYQMERLRLSIQLQTRRRTGIFFGELMTLHAYPSGVDMLKFHLCGIGAANPMTCMLACRFGHLMECHFPRTCEEAKCSHLAKYQDCEAVGAVEQKR